MAATKRTVTPTGDTIAEAPPRWERAAAAGLAATVFVAGLLVGKGAHRGAALLGTAAVALAIAALAGWCRRRAGALPAPPDVDILRRAFPDTVARVDHDGRILGVFSPHPSRIFRVREELLGLDVLDVVAEDERDEVGRAIAHTLATGTPALLELEGKDGPVETRVVRAGKEEALLICRFVGPERAAGREHRLYAKLVTEMQDAVLLLDADQRIVVWAGGAERVYGWKAEEVKGRPALDVLQPELVDLERAELDACIREARPCRFRARELRKDGSRIPVMVHLVPHVGEPGEPPQVLAVSRDMSAEAAAEADQQLLAALTREMADAVIVIDRAARILHWTGGAEAIYGWRADEVRGRSIVELLNASVRTVDVAQMRQLLLEGKPVRYRSLSRRRDGTQIVCEASAVPLRGEGGALESALIVSRDVTRETEMGDELARSRDRLASALESSGLGPWQLDCTTGALTYDRLWPALLGYGVDEIPPVLSAWVALADPTDVPRTYAVVFAHLKGETEALEVEFRLRDKAGQWRWIHTRGRVSARDASGRALQLVGTHADVTRRREAEECMRAALEANVRLVAELRDALANVKTLSGLLPVCAWCKKIRDDAGYWQRIETFLAERSDATFTHALCPECSAREFGVHEEAVEEAEEDVADDEPEEALEEEAEAPPLPEGVVASGACRPKPPRSS